MNSEQILDTVKSTLKLIEVSDILTASIEGGRRLTRDKQSVKTHAVTLRGAYGSAVIEVDAPVSWRAYNYIIDAVVDACAEMFNWRAGGEN